jgi:UDP-N-acetylglucosamine 4,6-dehydratase
MLRAADAAGARRFVGISTDKAVEPINAYGMTKGLQEKLLVSWEGSSGMLVTGVRYGNVLASQGSVVPYFAALLAKGETTLPITALAMTRFLLTLHQAVDLVLQAAEAPAGALLVPVLSAVAVTDLADEMLAAAGQQRGAYRVVGVRPGEKIHETLLSSDERRRARDLGSYYEVLHGVYQADWDLPALTSANTPRMSGAEIRGMLATGESG